MIKKNFFSLVFICITIILGLFAYPFLPETLVIQFGADNTPTNTAPKLVALAIVPGTMLLLLLTRENSKRLVHRANLLEVTLIYKISLFILLGIQIAMILYGLGYHFNFYMLGNMTVSIIFIIVGNYLYRARNGYRFGFANRWTLSNETVWKKTHQLASAVFILAGILTFVLNIMGGSMLGYNISIFASGVVICYIGSYLFYLTNKNSSVS